MRCLISPPRKTLPLKNTSQNSLYVNTMLDLFVCVILPLLVNFLGDRLIAWMKNARYRGITQIFLWLFSVYMRIMNLGCGFLPSALMEANYRMLSTNIRHENALRELYSISMLFQFNALNADPQMREFSLKVFMQLAANMTTAVFAMGVAYTLFCPMNKTGQDLKHIRKNGHAQNGANDGLMQLVLHRFT